MTCTKCGALLEAGSAFCSHCGTRVALMSDAPQDGARATSARPLGTVLIAVLTLLSGLMNSLVASLFLLAASFGEGIVRGLGEAGLGELFRTRPEFTAEFTFIFLLLYAYYMVGVLHLVASYGLFTLQSWAPRLTTILWIITAVVGILWMLFVQTPSTVVSGLFCLGAAALIYGYFGKPEIRSLYGS
jgi:hypothetical protein